MGAVAAVIRFQQRTSVNLDGVVLGSKSISIRRCSRGIHIPDIFDARLATCIIKIIVIPVDARINNTHQNTGAGVGRRTIPHFFHPAIGSGGVHGRMQQAGSFHIGDVLVGLKPGKGRQRQTSGHKSVRASTHNQARHRRQIHTAAFQMQNHSHGGIVRIFRGVHHQEGLIIEAMASVGCLVPGQSLQQRIQGCSVQRSGSQDY